MTPQYDLRKIRTLLQEGFTDDELRDLCYDLPEFRTVYNELAQSSGKAKIVREMVRHADQKLRVEKLLAQAKELNPERYALYEPYYKEISPPPIAPLELPISSGLREIRPDSSTSYPTSPVDRGHKEIKTAGRLTHWLNAPRLSLIWVGVIEILIITVAIGTIYFAGLRINFTIPGPQFEENEMIKTELERLRVQQGIDLGQATSPLEEVTSTRGTKGRRQAYQQSEVYLYNNQVYALYGPILQHYQELNATDPKRLGFPISPIQTITSKSGITGTMMEFEGEGDPHPPTVIYASKKGVAALWQWIARVYMDNGGPGGQLGLPLADEQEYPNSISQMFEYGYLVYQRPEVGGNREYREPIPYFYLASQGDLFDVQAQQIWQDTGVQVRPKDRLTIVQVGGVWTNQKQNPEMFDANGYLQGNVTLENATIPSVSLGTLIGRIGENNDQVFRLGRWSVLIAPAEGKLYLAMNDNTYDDNAGFITVEIFVEPSK